MSRLVPLLVLLVAASGCQTVAPTLSAQGLDQHVALEPAGADESVVCQVGLCRPMRLVRFALGKGRTVDRQQPELPYVHGDAIYVVPGDDFTVTGDIQGDRLVNLRLVRPGEKPAHALAIRFGQAGAERQDPMMLLQVDSKLPMGLDYQATIVPLGQNAHAPTSTCPVRAQRGASEAWPFPIELLVMRELRLFSPTQHTASCR